MEGRFSLSELYVFVCMEFQRFGFESIRTELADQCAHEVLVAIKGDPKFALLAPQDCTWRQDQNDDGLFWYYPEADISGVTRCYTDARHVGGTEFDQCGMKATPFQCLLAIDGLGLELLDTLVPKVLRSYVLDEAKLRSGFERDLRAAERQVAEVYKQKQRDRFEARRAAQKAGAK